MDGTTPPARLRLVRPDSCRLPDAEARSLELAAEIFEGAPFRTRLEAALAALVDADRARVLAPGGAPAGSVAELASRTGVPRRGRGTTARSARSAWVVAVPLAAPGGGAAVVARAGRRFSDREVGRLAALLRLVAAVDPAALTAPRPGAAPVPPTARRPATFHRRR